MLARSSTNRKQPACCFLGLGEMQGLENGFWILAGARHRPLDGFCLASFKNGKLGAKGNCFHCQVFSLAREMGWESELVPGLGDVSLGPAPSLALRML